MIRDYINSLSGNVFRRFTNPLLGTLIALLVIKNWEAIYALFAIEENLTIKEKIEIINSYIVTDTWQELGLLIISAVFVVSLTYLILWLTSFISDYYNRVAIPYVIQKIDRREIVDKHTHQRLKNRLKKLEEERDELESQSLTIKADYSGLTDEHNKLESVHNSTIRVKEDLIEEYQTASHEFSQLFKKYADLLRLFGDREIDVKNLDPNELITHLDEMPYKDIFKFKDVYMVIKSGGNLSTITTKNEDAIDNMIEFDLFIEDNGDLIPTVLAHKIHYSLMLTDQEYASHNSK